MLALLSGAANATSYTANTSGAWNNSATWSGAGIPGAGDVPTILPNVVVTIPQNLAVFTSSITLLPGTSGSHTQLIMASSSTLSVSSDILCGIASGSGGYVDLNISSGSTVYLNGHNIVLSNKSNSYSTFNWWGVNGSSPIAIYGGGGGFTTIAAGGEDVFLASWTAVHFSSMSDMPNSYCENGSFRMSSSTWVNSGEFVIPFSLNGQGCVDRFVEYSDFRDFLDYNNGNGNNLVIRISAADLGIPSGKNDFNFNTISTNPLTTNSIAPVFEVDAPSVTVNSNIWRNVALLGNGTNETSIFVSSNVFFQSAFTTATASGAGTIGMGGVSLWSGNFHYSEAYNQHFIQSQGTHTITGNIMEENVPPIYQQIGTGAKMYLGAQTTFTTGTFSNNIGIAANGFNALFDYLNNSGVTDATSFTHNTVYYSSSIAGTLLQLGIVGETYAGRAGMIPIVSENIISFQTSSAAARIEYDYNIPSAAGKISTFNCTGYWNTGASPGNGTANSLYMTTAPAGGYGTNDVNANPNFKKAGADLLSWDLSIGGDGSSADAISGMLNINSYSGAFNSAYSLSALMSYLQNAYTPTNAALNGVTGVGCDGSTIGAIGFGTSSSSTFWMYKHVHSNGLGNFILK